MTHQAAPADWREGYLTDADYTFGFYPMLNPDSLMLTAAIQGVQPPTDIAARGDGGRNLSYCELGCGQGVTLNVLAARDPGGAYYGIDYNPSQIRNARLLAQAAGITNANFLEESFTSLDFAALPDFDVIVLHGIYSWVPAEVRRSIVDIVRRKLKPGGLCFVSYNCAVGRSADQAMRRLLIAARNQAKGDVLGRARAAVNDVQSIAKMGAQYFALNVATARNLSGLSNHQPAYITHEYFGENWQPFFFADVARDMDAAKVNFIGQAGHTSNRLELCLTGQGRSVHDRMTDLADRELVKDVWVNQRFREDIYIKGVDRITPEQQSALLSELNFRLACPREDCALKVQVPSGMANLPPEPFSRMMDLMAEGPVPGRVLRAIFDGRKTPDRNFVRAMEVLLAVQYAELALDPAQKDIVRPRMEALGQAISTFVDKSKDVFVLPTLANGLARSVGAIDYFLYQGHKADPGRRIELAADLLLKSGRSVLKGGGAGGMRESAISFFRERDEDFKRKSLPILVSLEAV